MHFLSHSFSDRTGVVGVGLFFFMALANAGANGVLVAANETRHGGPDTSKLPLSFEPNVGQAAPPVKFLARGPRYTLFLTDGGATLVLRDGAVGRRKLGDESDWPVTSPQWHAAADPKPRANVVRLKFAGANPSPEATAYQRLSGTSNYFAGNITKNWRTNVPTYARVIYKDVYQGVDLVYYGNQRGELEYDFVVKPGSDPGVIALALAVGSGSASGKGGAPRAQIAANGDLVIHSGGHRVCFRRPVVCQGSRLIDGRYVLRPSREGRPPAYEVGFVIAAYDRTQPLVIDPVVDFATYLGGTDLDYAYGIAVDDSGNTYVTGYTSSVDFPVASSSQPSPGNSGCADGESDTCFDAFVTKLSADGTSILYSTFFGGSGQDYGTKIAVDASGHAYVTGYTNSTDFPVQGAVQSGNAGGYDAFAAELSADGASVVYSTYWGGSADDFGYGIAVDSSGNAYMAGATASSDFPVTSGAFQTSYGSSEDGFIVKFKPGGTSAGFSTFLGGSSDDYAYGVAVDSSGEAYITGATNSSDFPVIGAFQPSYAGGTCGTSPSTFLCFDAYVAKLNSAGSDLAYSTFLGGTGSDYGYAIVLDSSLNAYITGYTTSQNLPVTAGAFQETAGGSYDAYVAKLDAVGSALVYLTYLGGSGTEVAYDIGVDSAGRAFVTGYNYGGDFPAASPLQSQNAGLYDAIISVLDASGSSLVFSTCLGGSYYETGRGIAVDASGNGYVTGGTFSEDFPVTSSTSYCPGPVPAN